ncbi:MAG: D-alanine--D-alanine ligase [Alphaproteobacteria bacterium]|nr:D-alanine--D-alanine ligase [Alphaproteobacteria bacterium]MBN2780119.1 D-alanine--D-alanine ligase [Alphaproteobacteria bacterium]
MIKVCVLKGGLSSEREISLMSAGKVEAALKEKGYTVFGHDYQNDADLLRFLKDENIDVVFNALHGGDGEDGHISECLKNNNILYTYSDQAACAIAMDKEKTKSIAQKNGIAVPGGYQIENPNKIETLPYYPMVIKPVDEGSSVGIYIVKSEKEWKDVKAKLDPSWHWMIEEYIPGRELTTTVLFDKALTVTDLVPSVEFYDYKAKYTDGMTAHTIPADIPKDIFEKCLAWSLNIHKALGCRQVSRSDFRYDPKTNTLAFLEVNTHPGMTDLSLVPEQYVHVTGKTYADLCDELVKDALK